MIPLETTGEERSSEAEARNRSTEARHGYTHAKFHELLFVCSTSGICRSLHRLQDPH